jgi:hypothetical protein
MCDPVTIIAGVGLAVTALGQYQQGQTAKAVGRNNQVMAEYAAQDAQRRGEQEAQAVRRRGDAIKGQQRARMAAAGLDLGVGTSADLQDQTDFFSESDQQMARFNAKRDAWSLRAKGVQAGAEGAASARQGTIGAFGTALSGAGQVAGKWYSPSSTAAAGGTATYGGSSSYDIVPAGGVRLGRT